MRDRVVRLLSLKVVIGLLITIFILLYVLLEFLKSIGFTQFSELMLGGYLFLALLGLVTYQTINHQMGTIKAKERELQGLNQQLNEMYQMEQKRNQLTSEVLFYNDATTGVRNRTALIKELARIKEASLFIVDVKHFNKLNNIYGIVIGDLILNQVAFRLLMAVRDRCAVFRFDSDRFVVLHSGENKQQTCVEIAKAAKAGIEDRSFIVNLNDSDIDIDLNVTIAMVREKNDSVLETLDLALQFAKKTHNDFFVYSQELLLEEEERSYINIIKTVKDAIKKENIVMEYQPIVFKDHVKYEALVRIDQGDSFIYPRSFLEQVFNTKYYVQITRIVFDLVIEKLETSHKEFSLNLTYSDINDEALTQYITSRLSTTSLAHLITFEVLESEYVKDFEVMKEFILLIKQYGCKIAIDDFGSGYSNFNYITQMRPEFIKIDGSIISSIASSSVSYEMAKAITNFAHELGIEVIAEYVHNEEVKKACEEIGVDGLQGFYIGTPKVDLQ